MPQSAQVGECCRPLGGDMVGFMLPISDRRTWIVRIDFATLALLHGRPIGTREEAIGAMRAHLHVLRFAALRAIARGAGVRGSVALHAEDVAPCATSDGPHILPWPEA